MSSDLYPVTNDTKWNELRLAMYGLGPQSPKWRTKTLPSGYISNWDGEWFHHLYADGYSDIEWLEIQVSGTEQESAVMRLLQRIHVPGHKTEHGYKVFGYLSPGQGIDYV